MTELHKKLLDRSDSKCELCGSENNLHPYSIPPDSNNTLEDAILACEVCSSQIEETESMDENHWRCLNESMWNENLPVQIVSWRMLARLKHHDLLEMMYLDEDGLTWAKATGEGDDEEGKIIHKDSNGNILKDGDSVVLIKDLDVKGATFTAKRGAAVHNIKLVWDDATLIEGRVESQTIFILTQYVKKTK